MDKVAQDSKDSCLTTSCSTPQACSQTKMASRVARERRCLEPQPTRYMPENGWAKSEINQLKISKFFQYCALNTMSIHLMIFCITDVSPTMVWLIVNLPNACSSNQRLSKNC